MRPEILVMRRMQVKMERDRMKGGRDRLFRDGVFERLDINYMSDSDPRHTLDVISPEAEGPLPVIIEIHGGGYVACEKDINRTHARWFALQGYRVVNGDYTLCPEGNLTDNMRELAAIERWVRDNAEEYGFDLSRVYLTGDSAGGHLVLLYGMMYGSERLRGYFRPGELPGLIKAIAPTCPAFSLSEMTEPGCSSAMKALGRMLELGKADAEYLRNTHVPGLIPECDYPPLFIITTPGDSLLHEDDLRLGRLLEARGRPFELRSYEGETNKIEHVFNVLYPEYPESERANRDMLAFFAVC